MPPSDLREFLAALLRDGEVHRVPVTVDPAWEVAAITRRVADARGPALVFERVAGRAMPLVTGVLGTLPRYARAVGAAATVPAILARVTAAIAHPVDPVPVERAPWQDRVLRGTDVTMGVLPLPVWHPQQAAPLVGTLGVLVTRDPATGRRYAGICWQEVRGRNRVAIMAPPDLRGIAERYARRREPMVIATAIGLDPALLVAASLHLAAPEDMDPFGVAGALRGAPLEVARCVAVGLHMPAMAEVVLEGVVEPLPVGLGPRREAGETGPYLLSALITAMGVRAGALYHGTPLGPPPGEGATIASISHTIAARAHMERARVPGVRDIYLTDMGAGDAVAVIQMERQFYVGNAAQAIYAFWASGFDAGWTIVVDADIDMYDRGQVEWALSTRVQPHRDVLVASKAAWAVSHIPTHLFGPRPHASRIGVDATKEFKGFEFPPEIRPRPEDLERVLARWDELFPEAQASRP